MCLLVLLVLLVRYDRTMSPYRYEGVPLTAAVFADLVRQTVEPGDVVTRSDIASRIADEHQRRGGTASRGPVDTVAKKALFDLRETGEAEIVTRGYWRISRPLGPSANSSETVELGKGRESVYAYYFPAYRDQAAYLGREEWPMKIGMTKSDASIRLRDQCGTAMPEEPVVGLLYKTDDARSAEKMLHSMLSQRGKHLKGAPGKEWFVVSLREIKDILDFATGG